MPKVSVIIPTYNRWPLLDCAVRSALEQSFEDFELIVVDDGSTDSTAENVSRIGDARVRYERLDHAERSRARNRGMALAQGEFLALLDDDDLFLPRKLEMQTRFLDASAETDLVGGGVRIIDGRGQVLAVSRPWLSQPNPGLLECLSDCRFLPSNVMLRRTALDRLEEWFDPEMHLAEDADFFIRLAHGGCRMAWIREDLSAYRLPGGDGRAPSVGYMIALMRMLDRYFERDDVPEAIRAQRDSILAKRALFAALRAYAASLEPLGERFLLQAMRLKPEWTSEAREHWIESIAEYASREIFHEPMAFVDALLGQLPASFRSLAACRETIESALGERLRHSRIGG